MNRIVVTCFHQKKGSYLGGGHPRVGRDLADTQVTRKGLGFDSHTLRTIFSLDIVVLMRYILSGYRPGSTSSKPGLEITPFLFLVLPSPPSSLLPR